MFEHDKSLISLVCASGLVLFACSADETGDGRASQATGGSGGASGQTAAGAAGQVVAGMVGTGLAGSGAAGVPSGSGGMVAGLAGSMAPLAGAMAAGSGGAMSPTRPGRGGAAGAPPPSVPVTNPAMCPAAAMDATPGAIAALAAVNAVRVAAGTGCVTLVNTISNGATAHCDYYAMYMKGDMCISDPHGEVMTCAGFTGASPGARSKAAGYTLGGGGEVMAFFNNPQSAVDIWINSVWHRTPLIDPSTGDMGYGAAVGCDVIDFGRGVTAPAGTAVVYPYDGQTNVPPGFNGANEGPMPPAPTTGWPSSSPVSVHAKGLVVTEHTITLDGDPTPIEHVWLDATAEIVAMDMRRQLTNVNFLYANKPFAANTKYRVKLVGTITGGTLMKEWTFTTGAARRF
jgi:uncharacterized protein YkwD